MNIKFWLLISISLALAACSGGGGGGSEDPVITYSAEYEFPANDLDPGDGSRTVSAIGVAKCVDSKGKEADLAKCPMPSTPPTVVQVSPAGERDVTVPGATTPAKEIVPAGSTVWAIKPDTIVCDFTNGYTQVGVTCKIPGFESVYSSYSSPTKTLACDGTEALTRSYVSCRDNLTLVAVSDTNCDGQTDANPTQEYKSPAGMRIFNTALGTETVQCIAGQERASGSVVDVSCTAPDYHKSGATCVADTYTATFKNPTNNKALACTGVETVTKVYNNCVRDHDNVVVTDLFCPNQTTTDQVTFTSPAETRPYTVANSNGAATESCAAGATSWAVDDSSIVCQSTFHKTGQSCASDVIACAQPELDAIDGYTGTRSWDGSVYGSCVASSCIDGKYLDGGSCVNVGVGYYSEAITRTERVACPTNSSTSGSQSASINDCSAVAGYYKDANDLFVEVGLGHYSPDLSNAQLACGSGTFSNVTTAASCQTCSNQPNDSDSVVYGADSALTSNSCSYASITCSSGFKDHNGACHPMTYVGTYSPNVVAVPACGGTFQSPNNIASCELHYSDQIESVASSFCDTLPDRGETTNTSVAGTITTGTVVAHGREDMTCVAGASTGSKALICDASYVVNGNFCELDCASTNPGNVLTVKPICASVTEATAKGWSMQGGTIVGKWPYDTTKWMVAATISGSTMSYGPNTSNGTWGYSAATDSDPQSGIAKHAVLIGNGRITDTSFAFCAAKNEGGFGAGNWYMPNSNETQKIIQQLGSGVFLMSGTQHSSGASYVTVSTGGVKGAGAKFSMPGNVRCYRVF